MTEQTMYADEAQGKTLKLFVYTGKDAVFTYYEDSGDGYGYENKEYALTEFVYHEAERKVETKERVGSYPGMMELNYEIELIDR